MHRRRRLLLTLVVALVVAGAGALAAVRLRGPAPLRAAAQDRPGPVLLVPGYGGSTAALSPLAARLRAAGRSATVVALPGDGTGDLRLAAAAVQAAAAQALATGAPSVDLIGYSAGGVTARYFVAHGGAARVRRVLTLGSPHHGTSVAGLGAALVPGLCPPACQQLVPGSDLLAELNAGDETPAGPQWLSLWTDVDTLVTPPTTASLAGAIDVAVQSLCPGDRVDHGSLPADPVVTRVALQALSAAPLTPPAAGC